MSNVMQAERQDTFRDKLIPWYFVLFFVVLAIVDGIFVYTALSSHTGLTTKNHYEKGLNYNKTIAAVDAQVALGWAGNIALENSTLSFTLTNEAGAPLAGATVTAFWVRPTQEGYDFSLTLAESDVAGTYKSAIELPLAGLWDVRVVSSIGDDEFQASKRLTAKQ